MEPRQQHSDYLLNCFKGTVLNSLCAGIILCMCPANERWRYIVTSSPIGWVHTQNNFHVCWIVLTHWGRVTHICVSKLTIIGSDNGLSPDRRQAIIWTNDGLLLIRPWGTNFSEILFENHTSSFKKMRSKLSSAKWRPFCLGLNVLKEFRYVICIENVSKHHKLL